MWGKGNSARARKPVIGNPTLVNKTLDDSVYQNLSPIPSPTDNGGSRDPFAKQSDPHYRVTSSIYSRDTVEELGQPSSSWSHLSAGRHSPDYKPNSSVFHETTEISPPDSPVSVSGAHDNHGSRRVSPIEEDLPSSIQADTNKHVSQIPIFRKFPRKDSLPSKSEPNAQNPNRITRWDDFSGEPTTSGTGKAAQVVPGQTPFHLQADPKQPGTQHSGLLNWSREQFQPMKKLAEARSRLKQTDTTQSNTARVGWKGPSGRLPMMAPVQDKKKDKVTSHAGQTKGSNHQKENQTAPVAPAPGFLPTTVTTITGGKPEKPDKSATARDIRDHHSPPQTSHSNTTPPRLDLPESTLDSGLADLQLEEQPPSRFSSSTAETTERGSVIDSSQDIMGENQSTENLNSIMSRKRPVPSGMVPGKKPIRKPTPSDESTGKPLPECPPEKLAETRVDALEARRDALARRKINIETIIHELTQVIQPNSIASDMAVREEVKRTVASLNSELADVKREDHEIGIALYRAYKKRDEQGVYEGPTGLWVKRVTS